MALLIQADKDRIWAALMRWLSDQLLSASFTKTDLSAAVDATDGWIDTNAAAYNAALPLNFRTQATLLQKTVLFCFVAMKRAGLVLPREG